MIQFLRVRFWVVGRIRKKRPWEFQGIFCTKKQAISACADETYFIGPATLNEILPRDTRVWPGSYYPLTKNTGPEPPPAELDPGMPGA